MAIPLDRVGEVGAVVRLTAKLFRNGGESLEIVLRPAVRSAQSLVADPPAPRSTPRQLAA
jgi:hypothetical protein